MSNGAQSTQLLTDNNVYYERYFEPPDTVNFSIQELLEKNIRWERCINEIKNIRSLQDNWDGEGAERPLPELINSAEEYINLLRRYDSPRPSRIVATTDGTIILEWQPGDGMYIEGEIETPDTIEWMVFQPGAETVHIQQKWRTSETSSASPGLTATNIYSIQTS